MTEYVVICLPLDPSQPYQISIYLGRQGKFADMSIEPQQYGELRPVEKLKDGELDGQEAGNEVEEDGDSDGWINVSDGEGDYVKVDDDSDEEGEGEWVELGSQEESEDDDEDEDDEEDIDVERYGEGGGGNENTTREGSNADDGETEAAWFIDKDPSTAGDSPKVVHLPCDGHSANSVPETNTSAEDKPGQPDAERVPASSFSLPQFTSLSLRVLHSSHSSCRRPLTLRE